MRIGTKLIILLTFILFLSACNSDNAADSDYENFEPAAISLVDTDRNTVKIFAPEEKELYVYFTGVGWTICLTQLVQLNNRIDEFNEKGINVYAISPSSPEEHQEVVDQLELNFEILTDTTYEFGLTTGFIDEEEQIIYRGYTAVNPETNNMFTEVDYLVGENIDEILELMEHF